LTLTDFLTFPVHSLLRTGSHIWGWSEINGTFNTIQVISHL